MLGQPRFQVPHALQQRGNLLTLLVDQGHEFDNTFVGCHTSMLHLPRESV
jgi:hypothetical protein